MMAFASVSGGAIFVPEAIERRKNAQAPVSYRELLEAEKAQQPQESFGKKPAKKLTLRRAA